MEEKNEIQKEAVRLVAEQIIGMLENNILQDNGVESFEGWCEDGNVFHNNPDISEEERAAAISLMKQVAPKVDELTFNHINLGY